MAVTVAKRQPGKLATFWNGGAADGAAQFIIDTALDNDSAGEVAKYDYFVFFSVTGTYSVKVSMDGTNWSDAVALVDLTDTLGTKVTTSVANKPMGLQGVFRHIQVESTGTVTSFTAAASKLSG
jgi:hypothetical protein